MGIWRWRQEIACARGRGQPCLRTAHGTLPPSAADLGPYGINVNTVVPGLTKSPFVAALGDETIAAHIKDGPMANFLGRPSEPEDIANVVLFLCAEESRQITGVAIHVSAGAVL